MAVCWTSIESSLGRVRVAASEVGLCAVGFPCETEDSFLCRCRRWSDVVTEVCEGVLDGVVAQMEAYLDGRLKRFDLALDVPGTDFQVAVWRELTAIPYGETRSYGEIAAAVGRPKACRAVGAANSQNPVPIVVPCHRVVGAKGGLVGFGGGLDVKRKLLDLEGSSVAVTA